MNVFSTTDCHTRYSGLDLWRPSDGQTEPSAVANGARPLVPWEQAAPAPIPREAQKALGTLMRQWRREASPNVVPEVPWSEAEPSGETAGFGSLWAGTTPLGSDRALEVYIEQHTCENVAAVAFSVELLASSGTTSASEPLTDSERDATIAGVQLKLYGADPSQALGCYPLELQQVFDRSNGRGPSLRFSVAHEGVKLCQTARERGSLVTTQSGKQFRLLFIDLELRLIDGRTVLLDHQKPDISDGNGLVLWFAP